MHTAGEWDTRCTSTSETKKKNKNEMGLGKIVGGDSNDRVKHRAFETGCMQRTALILIFIFVGLLVVSALAVGVVFIVRANDSSDDDVIWGCTDVTAENYNPNATANTGCTYAVTCTDEGACNFMKNETCVYEHYGQTSGCTDSGADNFDPCATVDDGTCFTEVDGCTDPSANNFNPSANVDDGSCTYDQIETYGWQCTSKTSSISDSVTGDFGGDSYQKTCENLMKVAPAKDGYTVHASSDGEKNCQLFYTQTSACTPGINSAWSSGSDPPVDKIGTDCEYVI